MKSGADLHMVQLMPLPLTVSCFSKIQIGFTFLLPARLGSPGKWPLNGCVYNRSLVQFVCREHIFTIVCALQKRDARQLGGADAVNGAGPALRSGRSSHERPPLSDLRAHPRHTVLRLFQLPLGFPGTDKRFNSTALRTETHGMMSRNVRRILVREVDAPLPPEAKKILKI